MVHTTPKAYLCRVENVFCPSCEALRYDHQVPQRRTGMGPAEQRDAIAFGVRAQQQYVDTEQTVCRGDVAVERKQITHTHTPSTATLPRTGMNDTVRPQ